MSPFVMSLVTGGIFFAADKLLGRKRKGAIPEPPSFTPEQVARFARVEGRVRRFHADVVADVILPALSRRSAVPVSHPDLERLGRVWVVVPLQADQLTAAEVVERARVAGEPVIGSLSLVLAGNAATDAMLLVVGGKGSRIERYATGAPVNPFAVLVSEPEPASVYREPPAPEHTAKVIGLKPATSPEHKPNGAAAPASPAPPAEERPAEKAGD